MKFKAVLAALAVVLSCAQAKADTATILPPGKQCFQAVAGVNGMVGTLGPITGGTSYTNGTYGGVPLTGGSGSGATANITVAGGAVTSVTVLNPGIQYVTGDVLSASAGGIGGSGSGFSVPILSTAINSSLAGGTVGYYIPSTLTIKQTWQDAGETILNQNPVKLDQNGCAIVYGSGAYRQIVKDNLGNTIWDVPTASTGGSGGGGDTPTVIGDGVRVGVMLNWSSTTLPFHYLYADGSAVSRTTYPDLKTALTIVQNITCVLGQNVLSGLTDTSQISAGSKIEASCVPPGTSVASVTSTTVTMSNTASITTSVSATFFPWGDGDGATTFNLPKINGVAMVGRNNMGGTPSANLTDTYYGISPNGLGAYGGSQSHTMTVFELASHSHANFLTDPGHTHTLAPNLNGNADGSSLSAYSSGAFRIPWASATGGSVGTVNTSTTGITITNASEGSSRPFTLVQPSVTTNVIIKVLPDTILALSGASTGTGDVVVLQQSPTILNPIITNAASISNSGPEILNGVLVPASITTSQNDYNPSNGICSTLSELQLSSTGAVNITGFGGGVAGCLLKVINSGSFAITLKVESSGSAAANRLAISADVPLASQQSTLLSYDGNNLRWRLIGGPPGTGTGGAGTVTAVTAGTCLIGSPGTITTSGTLSTDPSCQPIRAAASGAVCDGVHDDTTAMNNFATAVKASPYPKGIIQGTSGNNCLMTNTWNIPQGVDIGGSPGAKVTFKFNGVLVSTGSPTQRSFSSILHDFTIEGTSNVTYPNTTGLYLLNATSWVISNVIISDVRDGVDLRPNITIISGITKANPAAVTTASAHPFHTGDQVHIDNVNGMTQVNNQNYIITVVDSTHFTLNGTDSTGYTTYVGGGTVNIGTVGLDSANYNRFDNVVIGSASGVGFNTEFYSNSNTFNGSRCGGVGICALDSGNQNSFIGGQCEAAATACFQMSSTSSGYSSISNRYEVGPIGNNILSGAQNTNIAFPFYSGITTNTVDNGSLSTTIDINGLKINGGSYLQHQWSEIVAINFGSVAANGAKQSNLITQGQLANCANGDDVTVTPPSSFGGSSVVPVTAQAGAGGVFANALNLTATPIVTTSANFRLTCRRYAN